MFYITKIWRTEDYFNDCQELDVDDYPHTFVAAGATGLTIRFETRTVDFYFNTLNAYTIVSNISYCNI